MISLDTTKPVNPPESDAPKRSLLTFISDDDYLLVLDNSALEKFTTCPTSAMYYLVYGREAHARNAALTFGGAIHVGLERFHRGETSATWEPLVRDFFVNNPAPPDEYRTVENALTVLEEYAKRSRLPDYELSILSHDGPLVEKAFELPLGVVPVNKEIQLPHWDSPRFIRDIHVAWSGRIDLACECNGRNRILDHKTTSIGSEAFVSDFQLSNQTLGYTWTANKLWPELNISGFCLNVLWLKKPSKGVGICDRGPRGGDPALQFFRSYFEYSPERLAEWETNTLHIVSDFIHCLSRSFFPMHTKWCFGKYGTCPYHDVCTMNSPEMRLRFIQSEAFKSVTWNPCNDR